MDMTRAGVGRGLCSEGACALSTDEVVDEQRLVQYVHRTVLSHACRVVVVAVYGEDGQCDVDVGVEVVGLTCQWEVALSVTEQFERHWSVAQYGRAQQMDSAIQCGPRRLVLVEQVAAQQYEVAVVS